MITDPSRLIAYQRVSHIPEGVRYTYVDWKGLEFYQTLWPKGFWKPTPASEPKVMGYIFGCDPYKSESLSQGGAFIRNEIMEYRQKPKDFKSIMDTLVPYYDKLMMTWLKLTELINKNNHG